ncbi:MAG TPA: tetratricopeptide repeat protein [Candidatus Acidoferrum sp.]
MTGLMNGPANLKPSVLKLWTLSVPLILLVLAQIVVPGVAAQLEGSITGQILDVTAKPWIGIGIQAVSEQGQKSETKTDKDGKFTLAHLRSGIYTVYIQLPAPNKPWEEKVRVQGEGEGEAAKLNLNFKEIASKAGGPTPEQAQKQEEEKQKFQGMKQHFDNGIALLGQMNEAKASLAKAPADQRDTYKQQVTDLSGKAVTELEAAKAAAPEKDTNLNLIYARLGDAYEAAGRSDDAANAYKQAIAVKPVPGYYNNLGSILGRAGKIDEAKEAYAKSAELDPTNAAQAWRNFGITLYNANRLGDAVEPLQKSAELDPKNPQTWYLLGASLVYKMTTKKVGDREEVEFAPGTIEAYQKAIELDPSGPWGQQAKEGLEQLKQIAPGIDIRTTKKKKS